MRKCVKVTLIHYLYMRSYMVTNISQLSNNIETENAKIGPQLLSKVVGKLCPVRKTEDLFTIFL